MGTLLMRQASSFLQEKYRAARLAFTDVSEAELWVENVTDNNVWSPNTKMMTQIAEVSYDFDDYWRIIDALHKRLDNIDWKKWRQSYNSLILLEFLITHGREDFAVEFRSDVEVIKELATFEYVDKKGVNWGMYMKNKAERILELMQGGPSLQKARSKAIKLTNEIQGFGSSSSSSSSSPSSWRMSFDSYSPSNNTWYDINYESKKHKVQEKQEFEQDMFNVTPKGDIHYNKLENFLDDGVTMNNILDWDSTPEIFSEINLHDDYEDEKKAGFFQSICSKHVAGYSSLSNDSGKVVFRTLSNVGREKKKMLDRQYSLGY